ncbi:hypothetical protein TNCV_3988981 [Trichonephila clavipes]|nr:hypothetical protein TNCV_3988981 [Trichonephila clavipes]
MSDFSPNLESVGNLKNSGNSNPSVLVDNKSFSLGRDETLSRELGPMIKSSQSLTGNSSGHLFEDHFQHSMNFVYPRSDGTFQKDYAPKLIPIGMKNIGKNSRE